MPDLKPDQGAHALYLIRVSLVGLSELERGKEEVSAEELTEIRALTTNAILEAIQLLDLYLTGSMKNRNDDGDDVVNLVHHGQPWVALLSNKIGSILTLRKPTASEVEARRASVRLHLNGPLDAQIRERWRLVDNSDTRPKADIVPTLEGIRRLVSDGT